MRELTFYDSEDRPWPNARLKSSAIIGHTTETTTRIWIRGENEGAYWLVLAPASGGPLPTQQTPQVGPDANGNESIFVDGADVRTSHDARVMKIMVANDTDRTGVFDVDDLEEGSRYNYAVVANDPNATDRTTYAWVIGKDEALGVRTRESAPDQVTFSLLHDVLIRNNFGIIRMRDAQSENPEIWWDLFSNTAEPGGSMKMRRIRL